MSQNRDAERISRTRVVYTLPGMESVSVKRDVPFTDAGGEPLTFDIYSPSGSAAASHAVVLMVGGYPDPGFARIVGCRFKEMGSTVSWAQLLAASGLVAIACTNRQPQRELDALIDHCSSQADALGIDVDRLGVWASSGNAPLALSLLLKRRTGRPRCLALLYPYSMDLGEATAVSKASAMFGFVNPCAEHELSDLAEDIPMLLARAGQDEMPGLNASLDQFAAAALAANLPLTLVNHPAGPHGFDLFDDSEASRRVVRAVLAFFGDHLT
jgi:dienelactone hydrolase